MFRVENLSVTCGGFELGPLDIFIQKGEYWVLLGPSGAGKSILLQTIAGLTLDFVGKITRSGRDISSVPTEQRNIGLVFQKETLFPHRDVEGNLRYPLEIRRMSMAEIDCRIKEIIHRIKIGHLLKRSVDTLSGGECQRVAMARALIYAPDLVLLDEPFSALDYNSRIELQEEIKTLQREFRFTALHVTHSREEALSLATHIAVMNEGKVIQSGLSEEVLRFPNCSFVSCFLGSTTQDCDFYY